MTTDKFTSGKVTSGGLAILRGKVEQLNRRAARLGLEPMRVDVVDSEMVTLEHPSGIKFQREYLIVNVYGETPRINGWEVAARIEFTEAGNFVHVAPGISGVKEAWRTVSNVCQHCNTSRRRTDCIVIRHDSGEEKIVGRNCLADYIRTANADSMIAYAVSLSELGTIICDSESEFWGGDKAGEYTETLDTVLKFASLCIRKLGWASGTMARNDMTMRTVSTADNVRTLLYPPHNANAYAEWAKWVKENDLYANEHDDAEVALGKEWLATLDDTAVRDSEYLHNLRVLRDLGYIQYSKMGYAVSIIPAARKAREEETRRKEFAKSNANKGFVGEVGKRMRGLPVTVKRLRSTEGNYGVTTIITFEHDGNDLTWFASGDRTEEFKEGAELLVDATVKNHKDDARYGKSTIVNRVTRK